MISVAMGESDGGIVLRAALLPYLKCPAGSSACSVAMEMRENVLVCQCGGFYRAHHGVLDLRLAGDWNLAGHQSVDGDRYLSNTFVNSFYRRQYGCLIETPAMAPRKPLGRIPEFRGGAESYYQTMIGMVVPHVRQDAFVVDVGCALGRLTGEMARAGARIALGLDFSPAMAWRANQIMATPVTENIALALPETRLKTNPGTLAGWGLQNCVLLLMPSGCPCRHDQQTSWYVATCCIGCPTLNRCWPRSNV